MPSPRRRRKVALLLPLVHPNTTLPPHTHTQGGSEKPPPFPPPLPSSQRWGRPVSHTRILGVLIPGCGFRQQGATGVCSGESLRLGNNRPRSESRLCYFLTTCPPAKWGYQPITGIAVKTEGNEDKGAHRVTTMQAWETVLSRPDRSQSLLWGNCLA